MPVPVRAHAPTASPYPPRPHVRLHLAAGTRCVFSPARYEYDVATGMLREVDWTTPEPLPATARAGCATAAPR